MITGLLADKRLLITGVLNRHSIAWHVAAAAQSQGADVVLSSFGRVMRHTKRAAQELPRPASIVELDVAVPESVHIAAQQAESELGGLDGVLHAVAYGSPATVGGDFLSVNARDAAEAFTVSAHSLALLADATQEPLRRAGTGAIVGLTFETRFAWPGYNWMGVAKAALEATSRYSARDLGSAGVRVNLVAAGPIRTFAARGVPGFSDLAGAWARHAPLGWDPRDPSPIADACCFLLSDLARAITGEIVHVDGGAHATGLHEDASKRE